MLKLHASAEFDIELFDVNTFNYHYFTVLFKEVVDRKIDDPWGRLCDTKDVSKYCIQLLSNEGIKNAKYLLEKNYGNPHKIRPSYRREIKQWPQIKFEDARGFRKFHNFLLKSRKVSAS